MPDGDPVCYSITELSAAYRDGSLTPREMLAAIYERVERIDGELHAYLTVTREQAYAQAVAAEQAYRRAEPATLQGIPVAVKDAFHLRGVETTLGSLVHRGQIADADSGVVTRLRAAGAVFTGKTNTAEFGQSATTDNLLGPSTGNPWDPTRTPGGSSGGSAAAVGAGLATAAVGSDGGGSVRIPAAFCGLVGVKPTAGLCPDEAGFRAMSQFVTPGPLTRGVADARIMLGVLADGAYPRGQVRRRLRVAWCPRPEDHPVDRGVADRLERVAELLETLGNHVERTELPVSGWPEIFGPLVLDEEHRERGHLLADASRLTSYQRATLRAGSVLEQETVQRAWAELQRYRERVAAMFDEADLVLTPTVAVPAFPIGNRPTEIDGVPVDALWGAFPFAVPFNVAGLPALSLPCGLVDGLPVGAQLVGRAGTEALLLDVAEELEEALGFDPAGAARSWSQLPDTTGVAR